MNLVVEVLKLCVSY